MTRRRSIRTIAPKALPSSDRAEFTSLRPTLEVTDGNLARYLEMVEEAGVYQAEVGVTCTEPAIVYSDVHAMSGLAG
jgi:hypothetical protein